METIQGFITRIPIEYKDEFIRDIYKENLFRLLICAGLMIIAETVIYLFFLDRIFNTGHIVLSIIIFNVVSLPLLYVAYKHIDGYRTELVQLLQCVYLTGMLLLATSIGVVAQNEFVSINPYVIAVFAIAAIMINPPIENMIMFIFVYAAFFYALPYYQANNDVVVVLRINAFIMNVLAWVLSRFVFRMKVVQFLDKKIIEAKNSELIDMANRDAMTFLFNHNNCYTKLGEEIERAKRIGYPMCVIFMDIDDFKQINDLHGHQAGDEVIIEIARILKDTCRSTDILCRYGGEEFAIIIPDTSLKDATSLAERIRININNTKFFNGAHVTVSGGIREFTGESVEELIRKADLQLYKAKCNGKNRFETDYSSHST